MPAPSQDVALSVNLSSTVTNSRYLSFSINFFIKFYQLVSHFDLSASSASYSNAAENAALVNLSPVHLQHFLIWFGKLQLNRIKDSRLWTGKTGWMVELGCAINCLIT